MTKLMDTSFTSPPPSSSSSLSTIAAPTAEEVLLSTVEASEAVNDVIILKNEEIAMEKLCVSNLRIGIVERISEEFIEVLEETQFAMKMKVREMRRKVASFEKEMTTLPENIASMLNSVDSQLQMLWSMEWKGIDPLFQEEYRFWHKCISHRDHTSRRG
ncbi:hypothetical protein PENTCL1PPCAC_26250 [Pristionchus entomophagus]|uniref:Uncharacterized protein n=1 Tax=Pristionchus entomophagus TaxID=358040 RepID=A0AAV5UAZ6_9BILA|nr:hypothetical protein PENTCL1PPCAC_26250 [Pristionchus entomophagus]